MFVTANTYLDAMFLLLGDNSDRSRAMVKEFLELTDKQNNKRDIVTDDDNLIDVLRMFVKSVIAEKISQENETAAKILLLKVRTNEVIKSHPLTRDLLTDVLSAENPISADQINEYLKKMRNTLLAAEIDISTRKLFAKSRTIGEIHDADEQASEIAKMQVMLSDSAKSIERRQSSSENKGSESYVSLSDPESIERALVTYMERSVTGLIKTGLQGMNRSLGARGALGLGETAVFCANSHNYKSGMLISFMLWAVIYNKILVEPGKKAMVYFVSLENEVHQNLMTIFKTLYCRVEKRNVDVSSFTPEFIKTWLKDYFAQYDCELYIDRYTPHEFSFQFFRKRYNAFVDMGFQIILFDLDYMSEARGIDPGDTLSSQGQIQLIKENYLKFVNDAKQCGYLLTTGHQLTKKAEEIASQQRYAVKKFNASMMADSSDVFRIVDVVFYLHLENNVDNIKFLTVQNRKNRGNENTPERDKFFAYAFSEFGIEDDILGLPKYVQDIDAWGIEDGVRDGALSESVMF